MDLLQAFKNYLLGGKINASKVTAKNYIADVRKFILWYEKTYTKPFNPAAIASETINDFKKTLSEVNSINSVERYISSLRKFYTFLKQQGTVNVGPFDSIQTIEQSQNDSWHLHEFKNYLYIQQASRLTIKNYIIDCKQFFTWFNSTTTTSESIKLIDNNTIELYSKHLSEQQLSPVSINRKLSSLRKYVTWACEKGLINPFAVSKQANNLPKPIGEETLATLNHQSEDAYLKNFHTQIHPSNETPKHRYSVIPPIRLFQKILTAQQHITDLFVVVPLAKLTLVSETLFWVLRGKPVFAKRPKELQNIINKDYLHNLSFREKTPKNRFHNIYNKSPEWFKRYQRYPFAYYLNIVIITVFISAIAFALYTQFVLEPRIKTRALAALPTAPPRILSFQGRLTDSSDNPITSRTDLRFSIYNDSAATGSALLWQENLSATPDTDGIFSTLLGNNTSIPSTLFSQNASLYLGVTVGQTAELTPRQQLATVAYAANSETLQGLPPITAAGAGTANVVLALDSSGNLSIGGSANPTFQATGGQFKLSGQPLVLSTNTASNGNIQLSPDGLGKIDIQRPLTNTTTNNNIPSAAGAVEVDSLLAVLATSSGQSAFTINQNGAGPLISASASGVSKFTVDNNGNVGIGTANTTVPLTLASNGKAFLIGDGTNTSAYTDINNERSMFGYDGSNATVQGGSSKGIKFNVNNASFGSGTAMLLDTNGNVGINTLTPNSFKLQVAGNIGPDATDAYNLGSSSLEWNNLYVKNIISPSSGGTSGYWQLNSGVLSPTNITNDLLIGATATNSALFQVFGSGTNAGTASHSGNLTFRGGGAQQVNLLNNSTLSFLTSVGGDTGVNTATPALYIASNGNIGFGTNSLGSSGITLASGYGINPSSTDTIGLGTKSKEFQGLFGSVGHFQRGIEVGTNTLISGSNNTNLGTTPIATLSAQSSFAALVVNNDGVGDLFTASSSSIPVFTIKGNGQIVSNNYKTSNGILYTDNTGLVKQSNTSSPSQCLTSDGSNNLTWGSCSTGTTSFQEITNATSNYKFISPNTITDGLSLGAIGSGANVLPFSTFYVEPASNSKGQALVDFNQTGTGPIFTASSSGVSKFLIDNAGNLGVGTNTPQNKLDVNGAVAIGSYAGNNIGLTNGLIVSGQVGIGTSSAAQKVEINGSADVFGDTNGFIVQDAAGVLNTNPSYTASFRYDKAFAGLPTNIARIRLGGGLGTSGFGISNYDTMMMYITNNGFVDIGTNNTGQNATLDTSAVNGTVPIGYFHGSTAFAGLEVNNTGNGDLFTASQAGNPKFVITNAGNVGVGTTTPGYALDIGNSGNLNISGKNIYLNGVQRISDSASSNYTRISPQSNKLVLYNGSANQSFEVYDTSGNNALTILQNGSTSTRINASNYSTNANNPLALQTGGNGVVIGQDTGLASSGLDIEKNSLGNAALVVANTGGAGDIFTASSGASPKFVINSAGNVGIGTTTPTDLLTVAGNIGTNQSSINLLNSTATTVNFAGSATGINIGANTGATNVSNTLKVNIGATNGTAFVIDVPTGTNSDAVWIQNTTTDSTHTAWRSGKRSNNLDYWQYGSDGTNFWNYMKVLWTNKYLTLGPDGDTVVGIGTTTPLSNAGLDVEKNSLGNAALVANNSGGAGDIFTASSAGNPKFVINSNGNIGFYGSQTVASTFTSVATSAQTWTFPNATGTVCLSGQTCASSGTVGYFQRTASGGYNYLAPATISDNLSIGATTGLTASGLSVKVNSLGNAAGYVENSGGAGDIFTASSAGSPKFVIDKNGNVGINTTLPTSPLYVSGAPSTSLVTVKDNVSGGTLTLGSQNSGETYITWGSSGQINGSNSNFNINSTSRPLVFQQGGSEKIRMDTNGNLGIGNSSPLVSLDVTGSASVSGNVSFRGSGTAHQVNLLQNGTLGFYNSVGGDTGLPAAGSPALFVNNNGYIGINTNSPSKELTINNSGLLISGGSGLDASPYSSRLIVDSGNSNGHSLMDLRNNVEHVLYVSGSGTGNANSVGIGTNSPLSQVGLDIEQNSNGNAAEIVNNSGGQGDIFTASSAGSPKFVINSAGNVGIGTTTPATNLDVENSSNTGTYALQVKQNNALSYGAYIFVNHQSSTIDALNVQGWNGSSVVNGLDVKGNGNVGIGTTTPGALLDVSGTTRVVTLNATTALQTGGTTRIDANGTIIIPSGQNLEPDNLTAGSVTFIKNAGAHNVLGQDNSNFFWDTTNLGLGIGTNSILAKSGLDIEKNSLGNSAFVVNNSGGAGDVFTASSAGSPKFVINSAGNVGIGVTKPSATIEVHTGSGGSPAYMYLSDVPSNSGGNAQIIGQWAASSNWGFGAASANSVDSAVRIGRTSGNGNDSWGTDQNVTLTIGGTSTTSPLLRSGIDVENNSLGNATLVVNNSGGAGDILTASSAGTPKFVIDKNGNVGVGTTTPTQALQITGGNILLDNNQNIDFKDSGGTVRQALTYTGSNTLEFVQPRNNSSMSLELTSANSNGNFNIWTQNTERFRIDSGGNIGINTQSPLGILDIRGTNGTNTMSGTIPVASISGATSFAGLVVDNSGPGDLFSASSSGLSRFVITQNGNVGVGTTTPGTLLHVNGTGAIGSAFISDDNNGAGGSNGLSQFSISNTTSGKYMKLILNGPASNGGSAVEFMNNGTSAGDLVYDKSAGSLQLNNRVASQPITFGTFNSGEQERLRIDQNGLIGINTTSALGILDVRGIGTNTLSGTVPVASISGKTSFASFLVDNAGTGDLFAASTSGLSRFVINSSGNITDANYAGANAVLYAAPTTGVFTTTTTTTGSQCLVSAAGASGTPSWGSCSAGSNFWQHTTNNGNQVLAPVTLTDELSVGNAGTGSFLPYSSLYVEPSINSKGNALVAFNQTGNGDILTASSGGVAKFRVDKNGNLGIGSNINPTALVTIDESIGNQPGILFSNGPKDIAYGPSENLQFGTWDGSTWSEKMRLDSNGNIGIATTTVNAALQIGTNAGASSPHTLFLGEFKNTGNGQGQIDGNWNASTAWAIGSSPTSGDKTLRIGEASDTIGTWNANQDLSLLIDGAPGTTALTSTGLDVERNSKGNAAAVINNVGGAGDIFTASSASSPKFVINKDGNVGIGTTTPGNLLTVSGNANDMVVLNDSFNASFIRPLEMLDSGMGAGENVVFHMGHDTSTNNTGYFGFHFVSTGNYENYITMGFWGNDNLYNYTSSGHVVFGSSAIGNAALSVNQAWSSGDIFSASQSGSTKFVINNNGNVGIGTNNPTDQLDLFSSLGSAQAFNMKNNFNQASSIQLSDNTNGLDFALERYGNTRDFSIVNNHTGNDQLYFVNSNQYTGFNTTTPNAIVDIRGTNGETVLNGTVPVASISAKTSFASLVVDNSGLGDILTASSSGLSRFTVMQSGNILIGDAARIGFTGSTPTDSFNYSVYGSLSGNETAINGPNSSGVVTFKVNNSEKMRLNSSGNLGIGTNNPGASLDLNTGTIQGAGLSSDCSGTTSKLLWSSSSKQFSCGTDKPNVMVIKSANQTVNSSTVLVNDTDLKFSVQANETWIVHLVMGLNTTTTAGWRADFTAPTGTTCSYGFLNAAGSNDNNACAAVINQNTQNPQITNIDGTFAVGANAGTVQFQWAQGVAQALNTVVHGNQSYILAYKTTGADYAETYYTKDSSISPGSVVSIDGSLSAGFKKSQGPYDKGLMGVVSTKPGEIIGDYQSQGKPMPIALDGRVPVRVNLENGPIRAGDYLTSSSTPGVAMKATQAGEVIGKALTDYDGFAGAEGEVIAYLQRGWADPSVTITDTGTLRLSPIDSASNSASLSAGYTLFDQEGNLIKRIGAFSEAIIASLQVGAFDAKTAVINTFTATTARLVNLTADKIISPVAEIDTLHTKIISPLGEDGRIALAINNDNIEVKNGASGSAVATIDNQGNQHLLGNLQVGKDATISGTLHAGKIYADEIAGLPTASASSTVINNITNIYESSPSATPTLTPTSSPTPIPTVSLSPVASTSAIATTSALLNQVTQTATNNSYTNLASYSGYLSYVPHLGDANFSATGPDISQVQAFPDLAVSGTLSVGSRLVLADNSINVLGGDLELQPLRQGGVSIADGNVYIDSNGNLTVKGDATFTGNLAVNIISPLADHNLTISLNNKNATNSANAIQPQLNVKNASGSGIFAINQLGDIIASGAATISKLNLQVAPQALAVSNTEQVASGSAGTASIRANQTEVTIDNTLVTDHSLIYITPVGPTDGNSPYLLRQVNAKSFSVGIQVPNTQDTVFNWLIIN